MLNLNNKSVFDNVTHNRLLYNIRKRKVFESFFEFVKDFLKNKHIIITIDNYTTIKRMININISQNSSLLLILYFFYNINLLETCDNIKLQISSTKFVNNVNILTYIKTTKRNYRVLNKIHKKCEQQSQIYDTKFSKLKYKLIYFSKTSK